LAVLFTIMLIATCDLLEEPSGAVDDDSPRFTPDGRPMVSVTIDLGDGGAGRALIAGNASNDSKEFEVVFYDSVGTKTYRANWEPPDTSVTIHVPVGNYAGAENAVVFAGTNETLLAVGSITKINGTPITSLSGIAQITAGSNLVTFGLLPLESISFLIDSASGTDDPALPGYKVFSVPINSSSTGVYVVGGSALTNGAGIMIRDGAWKSTSITPVPEITGYVEMGGHVKVTGSSSTGIIGPLVGNLELPFDIDTMTVDNPGGYTKIYIDVPVAAINTDPDDNNNETALDWYIRGGLDFETLDSGSNKGGAVMLKVGDPALAAPEGPEVTVEGDE